MVTRDANPYAGNIRRFYIFRFLMDLQLWLPIWVIYLREERDLSLTQITALDAPFWLVMVLAEVPTGAVADRFGRKVSLAMGAGVNCAAIFIFGIADSYAVLLASYILWAVAWTLCSGADSAFFFDSLKHAGREHEFEKLWGRTRSVAAGAGLLALIAGAPLADATALWVPVMCGAATMAVAFLVALTFVEPPHLAEGEEQLSLAAGTKEAARLAFGTPAIRYMMLFGAVTTASASAASILAQPFLESHGVDIGHYGWFLVPGSLLGMAAAFMAYRVAQGFGLERTMALLPLGMVAAFAGLAAWDSLGAFVFLPMTGIVISACFPLVGNYLHQRIPSSRRATVLSLYQLLFSLVLMGLEPGLGAIGDEWGLPAAYRVAGILLAVTALPAYLFWLRAHRRTRGQPDAIPAHPPAVMEPSEEAV
ncbi:MAG: MFS transporter [Dehalococcoidia bacterium]|nr:MFS transporter [Dehalococcoidia bacterium]